MRSAIPSALLIMGLLMTAPAAVAQEEADSTPASVTGSIPAIVVDMQDHWKRYSELADVGDQESADHLAQKMIIMRHQAGMLGSSAFARGFAMRAWRQQQTGNLDEAIKEYNYAISLEPTAREFRTGLASALAAKGFMNIGSYAPQYTQALFDSLGTLKGRYFFLTEFTLWFGVAMLLAGCLWLASVILRHIRSLHRSLSEVLERFASDDVATLLSLVILVSPLFFGVGLEWLALSWAAACWAFQGSGGKAVSVAALILIWVSLSLIGLSSDLTAGTTMLEVRAAFAAERNDSDEAAVLELEQRFAGDVLLPEGEIGEVGNDAKRMELFLYASGLRKLGKSRGAEDADVLDIFSVLRGSDQLGRLAAVTLANIQFEREDFVSAQSNYEFALENSAAKPYALYNLWRLNFEKRSRVDARAFINRLIKEEPDFIDRFGVENEELQPVLIDASPSEPMLQGLIERGLATATGSKNPTGAREIWLGRLLETHQLWVVGALAGMVFSYFFFRFFGISGICSTCGKAYSKRSDLDPKVSKRCQACNAALAANAPLDPELRRRQLQRIQKRRGYNKIKWMAANILVPGLGSAWMGYPLEGAGILLLWSTLASLVYCIGGFPRPDVLPFYSHWTFLSILLIVVLALASYAAAIVHAVFGWKKE